MRRKEDKKGEDREGRERRRGENANSECVRQILNILADFPQYVDLCNNRIKTNCKERADFGYFNY